MNPYEAPKTRLSDTPVGIAAGEPVSRWVVFVCAFLSALPPTFLSMLYTTAVRAYLFLGYWPRYGHPDPKDLPVDFSPPEWLEWVIPVAFFIGLTATIDVTIGSLGNPHRRLVRSVITLAVSGIACFLIFVLDPFGVLEWIVD